MILFLIIVVFFVFRVYNDYKDKNNNKNKLHQKTLFLRRCILCSYFLREGTKINNREINWKGSDDR